MAKLFNKDKIGPSSAYQEHLRKEHYGSKWGSSGGRYSGDVILGVLRDRPYITTILDFGAGKGSLGMYIRERLDREIEWTDYDPGIPSIDSLPNRQFDCVVSTDMLEHVEPDRLLTTLKTMESLTKKVLISDIACYPTGKLFGEGPYKGQDMHLIVEEPVWWKKVFESLGLHMATYEHRQKWSKGRYKNRCFMIHERV